MQRITPDTVARPASNYAHGVVHSVGAERLIISRQVGLRLDGTMAEGVEAQAEQAWRNVLNVVAAAGFERKHLARATMYVTEPGQVAICRTVRDRVLVGHSCANTYLEASGLAAPAWLVEIEAEAVKE
ncbi:MAG: RidA family protein [Hyphomicrobiaceae bacterium]